MKYLKIIFTFSSKGATTVIARKAEKYNGYYGQDDEAEVELPKARD